jgi:hypothetical protein
VRLTLHSIVAILYVVSCSLLSAADTLTVSGVVTKEGSSVVIRNALVVVTMGSAAGIDRIDSVRTDALGRYGIVTTSLSLKIGIHVTASGFQPAENIFNVAEPENGVPDRIAANFALLPASPGDTARINGVIADSATRKPLADASIIARGYAGVGGIAVNDTAKTDAAGIFFMLLPDKNRYYPALLVEKNGYKSLLRQLPAGSGNVQLDTLFLVKLSTSDSITYSVSGSVWDTAGTGIRGAVVIVRISNGPALLFTAKDTTSQWGGYYNVKSTQNYAPGTITVEVFIEKGGYFSKDTVQTLPSSTQNAVINVVLWPTGSSVLPQVRMIRKESALPAALYTVDGRYIGRYVQGVRQGLVNRVIVVRKNGVPARTSVQLR